MELLDDFYSGIGSNMDAAEAWMEEFAKRAEEMLHGELAIALDMPREQVPQFISDTLGDAGEPEAALA